MIKLQLREAYWNQHARLVWPLLQSVLIVPLTIVAHEDTRLRNSVCITTRSTQPSSCPHKSNSFLMIQRHRRLDWLLLLLSYCCCCCC